MDTVLQSCGIADCVASSYGGRNRKCAAKFATWLLKENEIEDINKRSEDKSEMRMKNGLGDLSDGLTYEVM
jgi:glycerol-3-phosphate dehydrogenase